MPTVRTTAKLLGLPKIAAGECAGNRQVPPATRW